MGLSLIADMSSLHSRSGQRCRLWEDTRYIRIQEARWSRYIEEVIMYRLPMKMIMIQYIQRGMSNRDDQESPKQQPIH